MKRSLLESTALSLAIAFLIASADLPTAYGNRRQERVEKKQQSPRSSGGRARRAKNKGAGVPRSVIDQHKAGEFQGIPYRLLAPENYDSSKKYPLILSLHGAGGVGDDNLSSMRDWNAIFVNPQWRRKYPCFVIVPQSLSSWRITDEKMPELSDEMIRSYSRFWQQQIERRKDRLKSSANNPGDKGSLSVAIELVAKLSKEYSVDTDRIYVLGHSMGGFGSWNAIWARPDFFAAAIPSAGGIYPWKDWSRFADVPVWTFHGVADKVVLTEYTRVIFEKMDKLNANMKFTELKGVPHSAQKHAFAYKGDDPDKGYVTRCAGPACDKTEDVWQWLFEQKRRGN